MVTRRYVGDYRLENVEDAKGRIKTVPVYRGKRFRWLADGAKLRRVRRVCVLGVLVAVAAELPPMLVNARMMRTWFVSAPIVLGLIPLIRLIGCIARLVTVKAELRREDRDLLENSYPASAAAFAALNTVAAAGELCAAGLSEGLLCLCPLTCAVCGWILFAQRGRLKCAEIAPEGTEA